MKSMIVFGLFLFNFAQAQQPAGQWTCTFTQYRGTGYSESSARQALANDCILQSGGSSAINCNGYANAATCRQASNLSALPSFFTSQVNHEEDIVVTAKIPEGNVLVSVIARMASTAESLRCVSVSSIGMFGVKFKDLNATLELNDPSQGKFVARISGQKIAKLRGALCRYQGPQIFAVVRNAEGQEGTYDYSLKNGVWVGKVHY